MLLPWGEQPERVRLKTKPKRIRPAKNLGGTSASFRLGSLLEKLLELTEGPHAHSEGLSLEEGGRLPSSRGKSQQEDASCVVFVESRQCHFQHLGVASRMKHGLWEVDRLPDSLSVAFTRVHCTYMLTLSLVGLSCSSHRKWSYRSNLLHIKKVRPPRWPGPTGISVRAQKYLPG